MSSFGNLNYFYIVSEVEIPYNTAKTYNNLKKMERHWNVTHHQYHYNNENSGGLFLKSWKMFLLLQFIRSTFMYEYFFRAIYEKGASLQMYFRKLS